MWHWIARASSLAPLSSFRRAAPLAVLLALAVCPAAALAQGGSVDSAGTGGRHALQGRLIFPSGKRADVRLKVRLESTGFGDLSVVSDLNGSFAFRSLKAGSYTIIVEGGDDFETVREQVFIEPSNVAQPRGAPNSIPIARPYNVQIYLRPRSAAAETAAPGVINAALASVPKPAIELYEKAVEQARRGENKKAVESLKAAIAIHPEFALALSELGVLYMKMRQPERAAEALAAALKLAPDDYAATITYGRALFDLQKYPESEAQFRRALAKNSSSPSAHFYVGLILLKRRENDGAESALTEAVKHGGAEMAIAHYYLGGIYWGRKEYARAADELETYLRLAPDAENAARVRTTIKELRAKR